MSEPAKVFATKEKTFAPEDKTFPAKKDYGEIDAHPNQSTAALSVDGRDG